MDKEYKNLLVGYLAYVAFICFLMLFAFSGDLYYWYEVGEVDTSLIIMFVGMLLVPFYLVFIFTLIFKTFDWAEKKFLAFKGHISAKWQENKLRRERTRRLAQYKAKFKNMSLNNIASFIKNQKNDEVKDEMLSSLTTEVQREVKLILIQLFEKEKTEQIRKEQEIQRQKDERLAQYRILFDNLTIHDVAKIIHQQHFVQKANEMLSIFPSEIATKIQNEINNIREQERLRELEEIKVRNVEKIRAIVSQWEKSSLGLIPYKYLFPYLKTTANRDATNIEWYIRNIVWSFKNDPDKPCMYPYDTAFDTIVSEYKKVLENAFGDLTSLLTFVCVPASSKTKNQYRWKAFSNMICKDLKMTNGYPYIDIVKDAIPKHLGGNGDVEYFIDSSFFKGKYVVLCDDVKTTGYSLATMKDKLESCGAEIICAVTIAQTVHE